MQSPFLHFGSSLATPIPAATTLMLSSVLPPGTPNVTIATESAPAVSESNTENLSSVTGESEEMFPGTITYNCPQGMMKYYSKGVPYEKRDGTTTAYYVCSRNQSTSKCTASIHLVHDPKTGKIVRRPHVPNCEQLIERPEKNTILKNVKKDMSSLAKDFASTTILTDREIANN